MKDNRCEAAKPLCTSTVLARFWFARFMPAAASITLPGIAGALKNKLEVGGSDQGSKGPGDPEMEMK